MTVSFSLKTKRLPPKWPLFVLKMSSILDSDSITRCIGKQLGDGCSGDFPRKDFAGLCARCLMLEGVENDQAEYERRQVNSRVFSFYISDPLPQEYPQCMDCGAAAKFFKGERCGRCRRLRQLRLICWLSFSEQFCRQPRDRARG